MRIVVVGGGVIGLTTAYQLARDGAEVVVLDGRATGLGASSVNAGWFVPSDAIPIPGPHMVAKTLRWMLRPDSPVYVRPSLDPRFIAFMLGLWRRCNAADQRAGFAAHLRLADRTATVFDEYRADGIDFEMHTTGLLMAFRQRDTYEHHLAGMDLVRAHGLEPLLLEGDDVRAHEPLLSDRVIAGLYYPHERHLDPGALVQHLHKRLLEMGVDIVEHAPVVSAETREVGGRTRVVAVRTGADPIDTTGSSPRRRPSPPAGTARHEADVFVLATGAWTGATSRIFGHRLPVRPGKGYSIDLPPAPLRGATLLCDAKIAVTPFSNRLRLAGTMEFAGLDEKVNTVRVGAILRGPAAYLREWTAPDVGRLRPRAGMRPMTPDGLPVIGALPGLSNTFVTSGHGMLGLTLAPGSAAALTAQIRHGARPPELEPFDPRRF